MESKIQNSNLLTDIFGKFPSFHDAEVLEMTLIRGEVHSFSPTLKTLIYVREMTSQVDENNKYILINHVIVEFHFSKIVDIELVNFNFQNVLQSLAIDETTDELRETGNFKVLFDGIHGVSAEFFCEAVSVNSVMPYERKTDK